MRAFAILLGLAACGGSQSPATPAPVPDSPSPTVVDQGTEGHEVEVRWAPFVSSQIDLPLPSAWEVGATDVADYVTGSGMTVLLVEATADEYDQLLQSGPFKFFRGVAKLDYAEEDLEDWEGIVYELAWEPLGGTQPGVTAQVSRVAPTSETGQSMTPHQNGAPVAIRHYALQGPGAGQTVFLCVIQPADAAWTDAELLVQNALAYDPDHHQANPNTLFGFGTSAARE